MDMQLPFTWLNKEELADNDWFFTGITLTRSVNEYVEGTRFLSAYLFYKDKVILFDGGGDCQFELFLD